MTNPLEITIIGKGKVGQSLGHLLSLTHHHTRLLGHSINDQHAAVSRADITLITTQDSSIESVCNELADSFKVGSIVAHCSGALSSSALVSAQQRNCKLASIHPLNSFPSLSSSLKTFRNTEHQTYLYAEGDRQALGILLPLSKELGFNVIELTADAKTGYHAACVFACNYLTTLMDISLNIADSAGLDRDHFWSAIQPLIQTTLSNISEHGTVSSLSGPIARGDHQTIEKHLAALKQYQQPYKQLGVYALQIAIQQGELSSQEIDKIKALLV